MKFKYNDIEVSYNIDLTNDLEKIRVHAGSFIRGANVKQDGTKLYDIIDETYIALVPEDLEEENYLNKSLIKDKTDIVENWEICRANIFSLTTSLTNSSYPGWANIGNNISGLIFASNKNQSISTFFDLGNKYILNTPIFLDLCFVPMSTSNGKIIFKIEYNKGNPNTGVNSLMNNNEVILHEISNNNIIGEYKRITIELNHLGLDSNSIIVANIGRYGKDSSDTYNGTIGLLSASLRYKINDTLVLGA